MAIRIELPKDGRSIGTHVFSGDTEIQHITAIDVKIRSDCFVTATLEVEVRQKNDLENVHALLGTKTLEQIATLHGYKLTSIGLIGSNKVVTKQKEDRLAMKVDFSNIEPMSKILDLIAKYAEGLPEGMAKELEELI